MELPPLEDLQVWVPALISSFGLKEGEFTFVPAYGGVILFIKSQGITWLPYEEVKEILGKLDPVKVADSSAMLGGAAIVAATGSSGVLLPILLVRGLLKGSYRTLINPPPTVNISFLNSMIEDIVITKESKKGKILLDKIEKTPFKENEVSKEIYTFTIRRKVFSDYYEKSKSYKFMKGIKNFLSRSIDPVFTIPEQSDIQMFGQILSDNGITVNFKSNDAGNINKSVNENQ